MALKELWTTIFICVIRLLLWCVYAKVLSSFILSEEVLTYCRQRFVWIAFVTILTDLWVRKSLLKRLPLFFTYLRFFPLILSRTH